MFVNKVINILIPDLERQQGLVDLCSLHPGLPVGGVGVRPPLIARQVNQGELAVQRLLVVVGSQDDLEHSVAPRGVSVGAGLARGAEIVTVSDQLEDILHTVNLAMCNVLNSNNSSTLQQCEGAL